NFDDCFTVLFVSEHKSEDIEGHIKKVSEIEHVEVRPFSVTEDFQEKEHKVEKEKQGVSQSGQEASAPNDTARQKSRTHKTIRVNIERLDALMNLFEELVIDRGRLEQIASDVNHQELQDTVEHMSRVSSDLQNIILTMRMVPIEQVRSEAHTSELQSRFDIVCR